MTLNPAEISTLVIAVGSLITAAASWVRSKAAHDTAGRAFDLASSHQHGVIINGKPGQMTPPSAISDKP